MGVILVKLQDKCKTSFIILPRKVSPYATLLKFLIKAIYQKIAFQDYTDCLLNNNK